MLYELPGSVLSCNGLADARSSKACPGHQLVSTLLKPAVVYSGCVGPSCGSMLLHFDSQSVAGIGTTGASPPVHAYTCPCSCSLLVPHILQGMCV
jgi:hypothetical protein